MFYQFYEWNHAFLSPARAVNDVVRLYYKNPLNPLSHTNLGRQIVAAGDLFERMTRRYGKPEFGLDTTVVDGVEVAVDERIVWERPFCRLVHFHRQRAPGAPRQPKLVIVAPMSGHYSTLLRGTVEAMLPHHEVYITDWVDARMVPLALGRFDLDDYIDYVIAMLEHLNGQAHVVAVCQPAVPVFAATAVLEARQSPYLPRSITLMGGPIDTRESPTEVNLYAAKHDLDWFSRNVVMTVPYPYPGVMRRVYPGFLQLSGFMTMNLDRHLTAHYDYFDHLVKGDGDSADKHRAFYDEYLSVMDLTAEFYLQTVDTVFLRQALPKGEMTHRDQLVDPKAIRETPILTIEGEKDDISGIGQTRAAHMLTPNLPAEKHGHYEQKDVGHYGVFNGSRFRKEIAPRISAFVYHWDESAARSRAAKNAAVSPMSDTIGAFEAGPGAAISAAAAVQAEEERGAVPTPERAAPAEAEIDDGVVLGHAEPADADGATLGDLGYGDDGYADDAAPTDAALDDATARTDEVEPAAADAHSAPRSEAPAASNIETLARSDTKARTSSDAGALVASEAEATSASDAEAAAGFLAEAPASDNGSEAYDPEEAADVEVAADELRDDAGNDAVEVEPTADAALATLASDTEAAGIDADGDAEARDYAASDDDDGATEIIHRAKAAVDHATDHEDSRESSLR